MTLIGFMLKGKRKRNREQWNGITVVIKEMDDYGVVSDFME